MAIALASVLALAGTVSAADSGDGVDSIDYWYWQDDVTDTTIQDLADQFEQVNGITVNIRDSVAQPQFYDSLVNAIAAGNAPDATHLNTNMFGQLLQAQMLEPLDDYIDAWAGKDDVIPSMWDFVTSPDGSDHLRDAQQVPDVLPVLPLRPLRGGGRRGPHDAGGVRRRPPRRSPIQRTRLGASISGAAPTARTSGLPSSSRVAHASSTRTGTSPSTAPRPRPRTTCTSRPIRPRRQGPSTMGSRRSSPTSSQAPRP